jgi:hypothetical protein
MTVLYIILLIVCAGLAALGIAYISSKIGVFLVDTIYMWLKQRWTRNEKNKN